MTVFKLAVEAGVNAAQRSAAQRSAAQLSAT
jgi:hypothetical protein